MVSSNLNEYLQIDLLSLHVITSIKTQGRFGRGQGQEFTEAYLIEYWRPSFGNKWKRWKNLQGKEVSRRYFEFEGLKKTKFVSKVHRFRKEIFKPLTQFFTAISIVEHYDSLYQNSNHPHISN